MRFPIFASIFIFCAVISHIAKRNLRLQEKNEADFWAREQEANSTRRKPLDDLDFIRIPFEDLPLDTLSDDVTVQNHVNTIRSLADTPIVNLTGYTNTDLKLQYGAANITALIQYDQSYTLLASTLQCWADALLERGAETEAIIVMEFAVTTGTDVSRTYTLLADAYLRRNAPEKLEELAKTASSLRSSNRSQIIRKLEERRPAPKSGI